MVIPHMGRYFKVLASFNEHQVDEANQYMSDHPNTGLLTIIDGIAYIADMDDMGSVEHNLVD